MKKTLLHILMHNGRLLQRAVEKELASTGLHHGQGHMLQAIARVGAMTQADLARRMDVKPSTVTNMLKPLEARQLVRREVDPKTNRAMVVSLTAEGEKACAEVEAAWKRVEERLRKPFSNEELSEIFQGLENVRGVLGGKCSEEEES